MRVNLLSNYPVPYQVEFLRALREVGELDVKAFFLEAQDPGRAWPAAQSMDISVIRSIGGPLLAPELRPHPALIASMSATDAAISVICGYSYLSLQSAMAWLVATHRKWVLWAEEPRLQEGGLIRRSIRRALLTATGRSDGVLAIGSRAKETWTKATRYAVPVRNFPYYCDIDRYLRLDRSRHGSNLTLLFSGQLIHRKGVDVLVRAFCRAAERNPKLKLVLAGTGPQTAQYRNLVPRALSGRVDFRGFVEWANLPTLYAEADVLVIPSRHDGWGLVVNEALASGLPVIASSAVGAAVDLVESGKTGYLVEPENEGHLIEAFELVAGRLEEMSQAARSLARRYLQPRDAAARFATLLQASLHGTLGQQK